MSTFRTRAFHNAASRTMGGRQRLRVIMAIMPFLALLCVLLSSCTGQMRPPSPITSQQRSELDTLAASKDAPTGLKEALAGIDANDKRHACQDKTAAVAQQMKMQGLADAAVMTAGKMGGNASTRAAKMVAVMHAKTIQAQVSQFPNCAHQTP